MINKQNVTNDGKKILNIEKKRIQKAKELLNYNNYVRTYN